MTDSLQPESPLTPGVPLAFGSVLASGVYKAVPEHFIVHERLGFMPEGEGEHAWFLIEKRGANTHFVARVLADALGVAGAAVGYAGLKDRHALTRQWFSVYLPGVATPPVASLELDLQCDARVLMSTRSRRKLRTGAHRGNDFQILLTDLQTHDTAGLEARLRAIATQGVPNAFGAQRFGREGSNLDAAAAWFEHGRKPRGRQQRGMLLSAARAWMFNQLLGLRVHADSWRECLVGEWHTSNEDGSLAPTGPLYGRGATRCVGLSAALEQEVAARHPAWIAGLERAGLHLERRRLHCAPIDFRWQLDRSRERLQLTFGLRKGEFATSVLAQIAALQEPPR